MIFELLRLLLFFSGFCIKDKGWEVYITDVRNLKRHSRLRRQENVCSVPLIFTRTW